MSVSIGTDRSTLLQEARKEWLREQAAKAEMSGAKSPATAPPDAVLIAQDPQLAQELAALPATGPASTAQAAPPVSATPGRGTVVNVLG